MANVLIEEATMTDIANAIRQKKSVSTTYKPREMATAISEIPTGITPTGKINITDTYETNVKNYASAQVVDANLKAENIAKDVIVLGITGTHEGSSIVVEPLSVTENGSYTPQTGHAYSSVVVNVPTGGELPQLHAPTISISGLTLTISNPSENGDYVTGYDIYADDTVVLTTTDTTVSIEYIITEDCVIGVKAKGTNFLNSEFSNKIPYVVPVKGTDYITFESDSAFTVMINTTATYDGTLRYSSNSIEWNTVEKGIAYSAKYDTSANKYFLYMNGYNNSYVKGTGTAGAFALNGSNIKVSGDLETLRGKRTTGETEGYPLMAAYGYAYLFLYCKNLIEAMEFSATTLTENCYRSMFYGCTSLTTAPVLPATTLANSCYQSMFANCTSLTTAPVLPATTLADYCYRSMFGNCTSLTTAPVLPATTLADYCYMDMFYGCTSLTTAPVLPAITLANNCYVEMFGGCTSLTTAPVLPATTLANNCYQSMFTRCTSLYISDTAVSGVAEQEFKVPENGVFGNTYSQASMFYNCAGTRERDAMPGASGKSYTYYTQNAPV